MGEGEDVRSDDSEGFEGLVDTAHHYSGAVVPVLEIAGGAEEIAQVPA